MPPTPAPLPIDAVLPEVVACLRQHACVLLRAPTGAGKTTRVPPALLDAGLAGGGRVVMLEPRRLAARAAARRIAFERGAEVGGEVGFHVRFERRSSARTRILVVTEGLLVRMLQEDPFLEDCGVLVFDEFHERNLDGDLSLAIARRVQQEARPDLKIVVMSATIATEELSAFLGGCPIVESHGRLHPVDVEYLQMDDDRPVSQVVAAGVTRVAERTRGDVLAFLPGVGEIKRAHGDLEAFARKRNWLVCDLYGDLPPEEQDRVLQRADRRKIVLATNVAETSVTIEGVTAVVDSGLARKLRFDPSVGLDRLELERIARSSAEQRAGRAGRLEPGTCLRLWTERVQRSLADQEEPEVRRVDLAGPALQLLCFGERDLFAFPWFEAPSRAALEQALALLDELGAVEGGGITPLGAVLARIPAHPRLARLLVAGHRSGVAASSALAAALLQERDPFVRGSRARSGRVSESDVVDRVIALERFEENGASASDAGALNAAAARFVSRAADQLHEECRRALGDPAPRAADPGEALMRAVFAAYPDRLARRRAPGDRRGVMMGGRGVRLADDSAVLDHELFVCVDVDAGRRGERSEALVRAASAVEREWLDPARLRAETRVELDADRERVVATKATLYRDLVLDEVQSGYPGDEAVARALAEAAARDPERALGLARDEVRGFLQRLRCLRAWVPELELPAFEPGELAALLPEFALGCRSFEDLRRKDLAAFLTSRLTWEQQRALDADAPERLRVPSGSLIAVQYELGKSPVLAARIQELLGLAETPRVARGRVRIVLHLLAPSHRPVQITEDLASFWNGAYADMRKEMQRRYPKHSWPEDPWNATPERRPRRRS